MRATFLFSLLFSLFALPLLAAVDLVTLPRRDATQLTIYNSVDLTMVRESRTLTLREGTNKIQFSWSGTLIDPTSIEFRILSHQSQVDLRETTYPRDRHEALQWNIHSDINGPVQIEIRYFTSGITWNASYAGITDDQESEISLKGYVRVTNNSGEEYENAEVRLVVGKINLVEQIATLARRRMRKGAGDVSKAIGYGGFEKNERLDIQKTFADSFTVASGVSVGGFLSAPTVEKKGLSEYFLFTIEGRETIRNKEPVQLLALDVSGAPLDPIFRCSDRSNGSRFMKILRVKNEKLSTPKLSAMNNLGLAPIPNGQVMLYSEYLNKDLSFLGSSHTKYVPIGERLESSLGFDPNISLKRKLMNQTTTDITLRRYKRRLDDNWVQLYDLADYDVNELRQEEVVNGNSQKIKCEIERRFGQDVLLKTRVQTPEGWDENKSGVYLDFSNYPGFVEKVDDRHIKIHLDLNPGEKKLIDYRVTTKKRGVGPELHHERIRERK